MVNIAICSDIHGNLKRLALFKNKMKIEGVNPENVYVLGDIVHYGSTDRENACIDLVKHSGFNAIKGNHDQIACDIVSQLPASERRITSENLDYLANLPETRVRSNQIFLHSLDEVHIKTASQLQALLSFLEVSHPLASLCFFGHSHNPLTYCQTSGRRQFIEERQTFKFEDRSKYLINPGSLGAEEVSHYIILRQGMIERRELK